MKIAIRRLAGQIKNKGFHPSKNRIESNNKKHTANLRFEGFDDLPEKEFQKF
jgi:hypothetical protein